MDKHDVLLVHGIFGISRNCVLRRKGVVVIPCLGCSNFRCGIHDAGASDSAEGPAFVPEKVMACFQSETARSQQSFGGSIVIAKAIEPIKNTLWVTLQSCESAEK